VRAPAAQFSVRVLRGAGRTLTVYRNGSLVQTIPVAGEDFATSFGSSGHGRYRLQLNRDSAIDTVTSPIYLEPGPGTVAGRDCSPLRVTGVAKKRIRIGRKGGFRVRCRASGADLRHCAVAATLRTGRGKRRRVRVVARGRVAFTRPGSRRVRMRTTRLGRRLVKRSRRRGRLVRLVFTAADGDGASATASRRTRLVRAPRRSARRR